MNMRILFFQTSSHPTWTLPQCPFSCPTFWWLSHGPVKSCTIERLGLLFPFVFPGVSLSLLSFSSYPHLSGGELGSGGDPQGKIQPLLLLGLCQMRHLPSQTALWNSSGKTWLALYGLHVSLRKERTPLFTLKSQSLKLTWNEPRANSKNSWISMASSGENAKTI